MVNLLIDTDPGIDDAIAILLALGTPEANVLGITTVGGNTGLAHTTRNALRLLELIGRTDIPVAQGHGDPYQRPRRTSAAEAVHGTDGLANVDLPDPVTELVSTDAVAFLAETIAAATAPVTLVALGPLTNIAFLCDRFPQLLGKIDRFVIMGGAARGGNVTPAAEFNIWADPEAAKVVFASELHTVMVGLDATQSILTLASEWDWLDLSTPVGAFLAQIVNKYQDFYEQIRGVRGSHQHDALAIAEAIWPGFLQQSQHFVDIECLGELTEGMTVVDVANRWGNVPNATVCWSGDEAVFHARLRSALATFR